MDEIYKKGYFFKNVISIIDLIDHIYRESREVMKGSKHEENFFSIMMLYPK